MGYLKINDKFLSRGLKPLEFLILAKVEEFTSKGNYCYITNSSLAKLFGVSDRTIKACIKKLIEKELLKKTSIEINEKGKKKRILTIPGIQKPNPIGEETTPNPIGSIKKRAKQNAPKIPTQEEFKEFFKGQGYEKLANGFYEYCTIEKGWKNIANWRAYAKKYIKEPYDLTKTKKPKATKKNHKSNEIPTQEEFKEFFKEQGQEKLANGFYEYCTNEKGWENITNWRAYAKKYIKEPYDLTKTKKPKATKKNHKSNEIPTQEEREALRREIEKMVNEPIAPLKRA